MARISKSQPLRYHIRREIINLITKNNYQPGDQLPTEQELGEMFNVSRLSLREALLLLEEERIISTKHGSGRYLASIPNEYQIDITRLQGVTELLHDYNIESTNQIIKVEESQSSGIISSKLNLDDGTPVISIERIRYANKTPIIYSVDTIAKKFLPIDWSQDNFRGSFFQYIEESTGIQLDHSQTTIRATILANEIEGIIKDPSIPWILLEQVIYNRRGEPIILSMDYHRGEYINFHVRRFRR